MQQVSAKNAGQIRIGDLTVNRIGLGTNRIRNDATSKAALKKAVSLGINFIDTAAAYSGGLSEETIGNTLSPLYPDLVIATKGGMHIPDFHVDSRPEALREQLETSLEKLKVKTIPLYFLHRVDPIVPLKDSISFLKNMQEDRKIKHIGLSEVSVAQIEEARTYIEVAAVENEYNVSQRQYDRVLDYCEREHIPFIAFFPLQFTISDKEKLLQLQKKYNASPEQLSIAWLLKRSRVILPIPGSLSPQHLEENVAAGKIKLSDEDSEMLSGIG